MRRNYTVRRSNLEEYYDVEYDFMPNYPQIERVIDHPRKLVTINRCADPRYAQPVEVFNPDVNPYL